jgi:peptide deformylase
LIKLQTKFYHTNTSFEVFFNNLQLKNQNFTTVYTLKSQIDRAVVIINPKFTYLSEEKFEVWDDCMCFPNLLVKVMRHQQVVMEYLDENFVPQRMELSGSLSELLQHEYDHLEGILATQRAIDAQSFRWRKSVEEDGKSAHLN